MVFKVIAHAAEEGGFWAEVPALPGCFTQAETIDDLRVRMREAIEVFLGKGEDLKVTSDAQILEIAV